MEVTWVGVVIIYLRSQLWEQNAGREEVNMTMTVQVPFLSIDSCLCVNMLNGVNQQRTIYKCTYVALFLKYRQLHCKLEESDNFAGSFVKKEKTIL